MATVRLLPALLVGSLAVGAASISFAQTPGSPPHRETEGSLDGSIRFHVGRARSIALVKLHSERCRRLFAEFEDLDGRALERVLAEGGETAETRLSRIAFRDGFATPTCERGRVYAFTSPGSLSVFICPAFRSLAQNDRKAAANILIHEELHSVGAGESPMPGLPSAEEITSRVELLCGR